MKKVTMDELLNDTVKATSQLHHFLGRRAGTFQANIHKKRLEDLAIEWKTLAANMTRKEKKQFFDSNMHLFHQIHTVLVGHFISNGHKDLVQLFRSPHDMIFGSMDIKRPGAKFRRLPTKVFTEFIKGITFFAALRDPVRENPVYHRMSSCGTGELTIADKFRRVRGYSEESAYVNREHVRRCYIERLIYNDIYENILYVQDHGHLRELKEMERLYQDLYPTSNLSVKVGHFEGTPRIFPTSLRITDGNTYTEDYRKDLNSNIVRCSKVENGQSYHKFQTFEAETPWLPGSHPTRYITIKPFTR
jgi:hypothetical protein